MSFPTPLYFALFISTLLALIGPWIHRYAATLFSTIVLGLAYYMGHINLLGVLALIVIGSFHFVYFNFDAPKFIRVVLGLLITIGTFAFFQHKMPGFHNWRMIEGLRLSSDSIPLTMYLNLDKSLSALLLLLALAQSQVYSLKNWGKSFFPGLAFGIIASLVLLPIALLTHYVQIDFKVPTFWIVWVLNNLLLVCIAEEVFFRGFVQTELTKAFSFKGSSIIALIVSALFFGAGYHQGGPVFMILSTIAGLVYGAAYMKTRRLETSIIAHFVLNAIHFFTFSYPALTPQ
ncbi:MAG: CPBP family intramembrane metalloprotease [Caedimonadaceae bacterium]|nr:MAG: CPBP family intramembrane metalloprotease [Caedimonadaceae bacterium]